MRTLRELRVTTLEQDSQNVALTRVKQLNERLIDFDVFLESKGMNLQRALVWTLHQKREIVMSVFLSRHIPQISVVSVIKDKENYLQDTWEIIDGKQRLSSLMAFFNNEFTVIIDDVEMYFKDLPEDYKNAYANFNIMAKMVYEPWERKIKDEEKIEWFRLINFAGTPQDAEHMQLLSLSAEELQAIEDEKDKCPECGGNIIPQPNGGIKCSKCTYWFCY